MNKHLNNYYLESENYNFYRDSKYYDEDRPMPPRDRRGGHPSRRSPNDWEPSYGNGGSSYRKKYRKDPKGSSRFIFQLFKRLSQLFLIISCLGLLVAGLGYTLIAALPNSQITTMNNYYFADIVGVSFVFGSIAGIVAGALYLILYLLMIFNRHGWLRRNSVKTYFFWLITFVLVSALSVYLLFVAVNGSWMVVGGKAATPKSPEVAKILDAVANNVNVNSAFISKLVHVYYNNSLGGIATGLITVAAYIVIAITGFLYYKNVNEVLENSYEYFDNRKRRW
ncbi:hypothetical protein D8X55_04065 [Malacoplasma penetrans]|nr:hypothetical protein [Malacoplasma penetrans]RXY96348.1 hypothetical protein D8X55_04065 [Malacoplasma penetrans]